MAGKLRSKLFTYILVNSIAVAALVALFIWVPEISVLSEQDVTAYCPSEKRSLTSDERIRVFAAELASRITPDPSFWEYKMNSKWSDDKDISIAAVSVPSTGEQLLSMYPNCCREGHEPVMDSPGEPGFWDKLNLNVHSTVIARVPIKYWDKSGVEGTFEHASVSWIDPCGNIVR